MKKYLLLIACLVSAFLQIHAQERAPIQRAILYDWYVTSSIVSDEQSFTAEYQAILNRATALGYTKPSAAQQVKQNQLIVNLKASGIWTILDVLHVFANNGSANFGTLNWINPLTFQASLVNSPTFNVNQGIAGNGSTSYINTGFATNAGSHFVLNNNSRGVWQYNTPLVATGAQWFGNGDATEVMSWTFTQIQRFTSTNGISANFTFSPSTGLKAATRTGNTISLYINTTRTADTSISTGLSGNACTLGFRGSSFTDVTWSCFYAGAFMTPSQTNNFVSIFGSYLTGL